MDMILALPSVLSSAGYPVDRPTALNTCKKQVMVRHKNNFHGNDNLVTQARKLKERGLKTNKVCRNRKTSIASDLFKLLPPDKATHIGISRCSTCWTSRLRLLQIRAENQRQVNSLKTKKTSIAADLFKAAPPARLERATL